MSERSKRRAAEMKVIDAANALAGCVWLFESLPRHPELMALREAVLELEQLGLKPADQGRTALHAPETSHEANASLAPIRSELARQVFHEVRYAYAVAGTGLTVDQVEVMLKRSHQSVSARMNELRDNGWVVDSGARRATRSGRKAIVWVPTTMALEVA